MVTIIAHRGASAYTPENSFKSFSEAEYQKSDYIEVDIRFSADQVPFVFHDKQLKRLAKKRMFVKKCNSAFLSEIVLKNGEKIISFESVLQKYPKMNIVCDIKEFLSQTQAAQLLWLTKKYNAIDRIIFSSRFTQVFAKLKKEDKKVKLALVYRVCLNPITIAKKYGLYSLHPHHLVISKKLISTANKENLKVFPFTVNRVKRMKQLVKLGVNGVITDKPVLMRKVVKQQIYIQSKGNK